MRNSLFLSVAGLFLFFNPTRAEPQLLAPVWRTEVSGMVTSFKDVKYREDGWQATGTLMIRILPLPFLHLEMAATPADTQRKPYCPPDPTTDSHCDPLRRDGSIKITGGVGVQLPTANWVPYLGAGYGSFGGNPILTWYAGLGVFPQGRWGLVVELRAGQVSAEQKFERTREIGVGLVWRPRGDDLPSD